MCKWIVTVLLSVIILPAAIVFAQPKGNADVLFVRAVETARGVWTVDVTVSHPDTGWKDYANGWNVVLPDDTVLKINPDDKFTRVLWHPHETEQPFTRSQHGLKIPPAVQKIRIRAHDLVSGFGGKEVVVDLTQSEGNLFKVKRFSNQNPSSFNRPPTLSGYIRLSAKCTAIKKIQFILPFF